MRHFSFLRSPAPPGVFCPRPDVYRRPLPDVPDQFSVDIETVEEVSITAVKDDIVNTGD